MPPPGTAQDCPGTANRGPGAGKTYLAVLRVDVLVVALHNGAVNEEAAHDHDNLQDLPQGHLSGWSTETGRLTATCTSHSAQGREDRGSPPHVPQGPGLTSSQGLSVEHVRTPEQALEDPCWAHCCPPRALLLRPATQQALPEVPWDPPALNLLTLLVYKFRTSFQRSQLVGEERTPHPTEADGLQRQGSVVLRAWIASTVLWPQGGRGTGREQHSRVKRAPPPLSCTSLTAGGVEKHIKRSREVTGKGLNSTSTKAIRSC